MINFIICDDEKQIRETVKNIINKEMIDSKQDYKIYEFEQYDSKFNAIVKKKLEDKIYVLDVEVKDKSGIEAASLIRKNDWHSLIMILTCHNEALYVATKRKLMLLNFIDKMENYQKLLSESIKTALSIMDSGHKLILKHKRMIHKINVEDINFITKDISKRTLTINTNKGIFTHSSSLEAVKKDLPNYFVKTHKAALVNTNNIKKIDFKENVILFKDESTLDLLSKNYKKEVMKYV